MDIVDAYGGPFIGAGLLGGLWFGNVGAVIGAVLVLWLAFSTKWQPPSNWR